MRPLRIVVADEGTEARPELLTLVERAGFDLVGEAPTWHSVMELVTSRAADVVLVSGSTEFAQATAALPAGIASIAVAPDAGSSKDYADCGAFAVLTPSTDPEVFAATAFACAARARDLFAARKDSDALRDSLETRKVVERAKGVLMRRLGLSEEDAYRRMQKASQDENRKMRDIAESILSAERLYGGGGDASGEQAAPKAGRASLAGTPSPSDSL